MALQLVQGGAQVEYCTDCEVIVTEDEREPIYDCGSCGDNFSRSGSADGESARCPSCNKFATKVTDHGHDCGALLVLLAEVTEAPATWPCANCERSFASQAELAQHQQRDEGVREAAQEASR